MRTKLSQKLSVSWIAEGFEIDMLRELKAYYQLTSKRKLFKIMVLNYCLNLGHKPPLDSLNERQKQSYVFFKKLADEYDTKAEILKQHG